MYDDDEDIDIAKFAVTLETLPNNMEYVDFYYKFFCKQTQTSYQNSVRLNNSTNYSYSESCNMQICEVSKLKQYKSLDFECYIDIIHIKMINKPIQLSPTKKVLITVHEHMISAHSNKKYLKQFRKEYKLDTKINKIMVEANKCFKYPFSFEKLEFIPSLSEGVSGCPLSKQCDLMQALVGYKSYGNITHMDPGQRILNFGFNMDREELRCQMCDGVSALSYCRWQYDRELEIYGGSVIHCINDEWKCGNCWRSDTQLKQKLRACGVDQYAKKYVLNTMNCFLTV
eukprot:416521_1